MPGTVYHEREFTDVQFHVDRLEQPLRWKKPRRIFVNSMSDLFHEDIPDMILDRIFAVMALCPHHTFQILTKRPERMLKYLAVGDGQLCRRWGMAAQALEVVKKNMMTWVPVFRGVDPMPWPLPNVWLGVSVEDQKTADERIPSLLGTPAAVRFVSYEPALGPVQIQPYMPNPLWNNIESWKQPELDWIIAGGESGPNARPSHPEWFRSVRAQCQAAKVPFFFKQWGAWMHESHDPRKINLSMAHDGKRSRNNNIYHWPGESEVSIRVGKKKAGATLDGKTYLEFPKCQSK